MFNPTVLTIGAIVLTMLLQAATKGSDTTNEGLPNGQKELVLDLNLLTYTLADQHDQFNSFIGVRALAMVHLAIHDIYNSIQPTYEFYHFQSLHPEANPIAAAAQSTRVILSDIYPDRADTIDLVCKKWIESVLPDAGMKAGKELGQKVAQMYIALRAGDGHEKNGDYTPMTKPGDYQYTPGFDWVWIPDFSVAKPFTLDSVSQFRSPPPPDMTSEIYRDSYNEVKVYGDKDSKVRSEDQTHYAHWWAEFGEHAWNRIGRITARDRGLSAIETNRMFALINMNLYDLYLTSFDSKYKYDTWRPITAIHRGDLDGNASTAADPTWQPEMITPPWPEYPSAHAAVGAAGAEIVSHIYGTTEVSFTMESTSALPYARVRSYTGLDQAARDCADSRVMNGFHFRFATEEGLKQGRAVARHTINNFLKPLVAKK